LKIRNDDDGDDDDDDGDDGDNSLSFPSHFLDGTQDPAFSPPTTPPQKLEVFVPAEA